MSQYKEYHEWNDLTPNHDLFSQVNVNGFFSSEQEMAFPFNKYLNLNPMSTLIVSVPTAVGGSAMSFDMVYHNQDALRAADPESTTAQFAKPGRPMPSHVFNNVMFNASRMDDIVMSVVSGESEISNTDMFARLVQERLTPVDEPPSRRQRT